jgi:Winged helix DNA-binding domain
VSERVLTLRELNRALLARQLLLERARLPLVRAIERIGALQAQHAPSPYIALWSRLEGFRIAELERALARGQVVKATLMRTTLHMVSRADYWTIVAALLPARMERVERSFPGLDLDALEERLLALEEGPQIRERWYEVLDELTDRPIKPDERWPLWGTVLTRAQLVHAPPSGAFGYRGSPTFVPAASWLGPRPDPPEAPLAALVRRYLGAFGPASVDDVSSWTGLRTPLVRQGLDALSLRRFRDEKGRLLLDLPRAPLPPATTSAPVRFLPKWDSSLLAHSPPERERILPERYRKTVIRPNGDVLPTFLVDGFVAGSWSVRGKKLALEPFEPLPKRVRAQVEREGERAVAFLGGRSP